MQEKTQQVDGSDAYIADKVILDRRTLHDMLKQYVDDIFGYAGVWICQLLRYCGRLMSSMCVFCGFNIDDILGYASETYGTLTTIQCRNASGGKKHAAPASCC